MPDNKKGKMGSVIHENKRQMERKFMILLSIIDNKEFVMNLFFQKNENSLSKIRRTAWRILWHGLVLYSLTFLESIFGSMYDHGSNTNTKILIPMAV